jgi:hypothetical protein
VACIVCKDPSGVRCCEFGAEDEEVVAVRVDHHGTERINWLPGDRARLYPEPTHEGPHRDDQFAVAPVVEILEVVRHRNNPAWLMQFVVRDEATGEESLIDAGKVREYVWPKGHRF